MVLSTIQILSSYPVLLLFFIIIFLYFYVKLVNPSAGLNAIVLR